MVRDDYLQPSDGCSSFADVDIMSTSSAHQSVQHIDFSLKIKPRQ
jgi:nicotinate-nucleotide pyrophosphorylase